MRFPLFAVLLIFASSAFAQNDPAEKESRTPTVDLELVLAVDVSYSMDKEMLAIQREGYAQAIASREFLEALKNGPNGKISVTYFEWAASSDQKIIIPWRMIDGPETADAVAGEIMKMPIRRASRTSISGAIKFAMRLFDENPHRGMRRVIDISGDGPNNNGPPVVAARDAALEKGVIINGLPIMVKEPPPGATDFIEDLDLYYEDCVTGGPGAFVMTIKDRDKLKEAIRTMLVREVAGLAPERPNIPSTGKEKRVSCLIGEELFQRIWGISSGPPALPTPSKGGKYTAWQQAEYTAHAQKCFRRQKVPILNWVELSVTIGLDGMIIGDPEIKNLIDNDEFRQDAKAAIAQLRQCQPFIVDPFGRTRAEFTQVFAFNPKPKEADREEKPKGADWRDMSAAIQSNFKKCWKASRTGPTIWVELKYKPDGTYRGLPTLLNSENTKEYSRTAEHVLQQINKCPPVKFPKDKYPQRTLRWQFPSHESANGSRPKKS